MNNEDKLQIIQRMATNLPVLRAKLSVTQEELANLMGLSRSTLIAFEKKQRRMTWNTFLSLILIFEKNSETSELLRVLNIYTDELNGIFPGINSNTYVKE